MSGTKQVKYTTQLQTRLAYSPHHGHNILYIKIRKLVWEIEPGTALLLHTSHPQLLCVTWRAHKSLQGRPLKVRWVLTQHRSHVGATHKTVGGCVPGGYFTKP